jgi:hypothetical protein
MTSSLMRSLYWSGVGAYLVGSLTALAASFLVPGLDDPRCGWARDSGQLLANLLTALGAGLGACWGGGLAHFYRAHTSVAHAVGSITLLLFGLVLMIGPGRGLPVGQRLPIRTSAEATAVARTLFRQEVCIPHSFSEPIDGIWIVALLEHDRRGQPSGHGWRAIDGETGRGGRVSVCQFGERLTDCRLE